LPSTLETGRRLMTMQAKTIAAVISLVTMVGAAYAAGTSVADNLLRTQQRETGAALELKQAQRDWALSPKAFGQSADHPQDPAEIIVFDEAAIQDPGLPEDRSSSAPEVQAVEPDTRTPAAESPELRSLMSGGREEEGYFFRSRGEDYGYGEGYEHEEDHEGHERYEKQKKKEKKLREAHFGLFEGSGAFEEDD
jgi:hypothetical protein